MSTSLEQAPGRGVHKRTDLWSFGCLLYEMPERRTETRRLISVRVFGYPCPDGCSHRHGEIALLEQLMEDTPFVGLDRSPQHGQTWNVQKQVFTRALQTAQRLGGSGPEHSWTARSPRGAWVLGENTSSVFAFVGLDSF